MSRGWHTPKQIFPSRTNNSLLASFRVDYVCAQLLQAGLDLHCEEVSDRHLAGDKGVRDKGVKSHLATTLL